MVRALYSLAQTIPLGVFMVYARWAGSPIADTRWEAAFVLGGGAALLSVLSMGLWRPKGPVHRLMLGVNVFLILGGSAVVLRFPAVVWLYQSLREASMFLCVLGVGAGDVGFHPGGISRRRASRSACGEGLFVLLAGSHCRGVGGVVGVSGAGRSGGNCSVHGASLGTTGIGVSGKPAGGSWNTG